MESAANPLSRNVPAPNAANSADISVRHLVKRFDDVTAVDDLSFDIAAGVTAALLGANGAGKTTTIAMLLGLLLPTSGGIAVLGEDMLRHRHRVLARINFSSPYVDLPRRLRVGEILKVYGGLYGLPKIDARIAEVGAELQIGAFLKRPLGDLSAGQRSRVALAKALLNRPEILFLDEPTASLDPDQQIAVLELLAARARDGRAVVVVTHDLNLAAQFAQRVTLLADGKVVACGTPREVLCEAVLAPVFGDHLRVEALASDARGAPVVVVRRGERSR